MVAAIFTFTIFASDVLVRRAFKGSGSGSVGGGLALRQESRAQHISAKSARLEDFLSPCDFTNDPAFPIPQQYVESLHQTD